MIFLLSTLLLLQRVTCTLPPGHGKPLGEHNELKTPAAEEDYTELTSQYFYERYVRTRTPVILRGLAKTFPAFDLWTDQYLVDNFGDLEVRLEAKTEKQSYTPVGEAGLGRASISEFFRRYKTDNMYCVSEVPGPMYKDLQLPAIMNCGSMKNSLVEMNLWINSGGAKSIIHKDAHNQLNCLLAGSKDWIFINNTYNDWIYQAEEIDGDQGGFSLVNPDKVNYITFPLFDKIPWEYATVHAGDCLYLPPRYYHRVKSTDRNFAVSFLFGTQSEFQMGPECGAPTTSSPLTEVPIQWKYPGTGMMSMGNSDPAGIKEWFIDMFLEMTDGDATDNVPMEDYLEFVIEDEGVIPYMKELFHKLLIEDRVLGDSEYVDRNMFDLVPEEVWREITVAQSYDPSNDPNNEYFHITKDDVVYLLKDATYFGAVNSDQFLEAYSRLGGSLRVARELFAKLTTDGTTVSWYDIRDKDEVFDVYGQVHDRGDEEMFTRNEEVRRIAEAELTQSIVEGKSEL
ncbi:hypothetical protein ACHWQZ_G009281 [Mnemiopsis leidyi]